MRTLLRVGGIAGMLAGALALALAPWAGIAVVAFVVAAGLATGLATAKWLPAAWYGRQVGAGLRAGLVTCLIAAPVTLVALLDFTPQGGLALVVGPSSLVTAARLGGSGATPADVDALAVAASALVALLLAAVSARAFAAGNSARFVKAVERAREASQPLHEESVFAPAVVRRTMVPLAAVPLAAAVGAPGAALPLDRPTAARLTPSRAAPQRRTLAPATPPEGMPGTTGARRSSDPPLRRTAAPAVRALPPEPEPVSEPPRPITPPAPVPAHSPTPAAAPAPALKRRAGGRPQAARLTPEMIEALATWARETEEEEGDEDDDGVDAAGRGGGSKSAASREPVESSYLNTPAPAPKRKRKKNATRDWIC